MALGIGVAAAASATVANLFVVEVHPEAEWDERIGWLQTFYGGGQVAGLLLAGLFGLAHALAGLGVAALIGAAAAVTGWLATKTPNWPCRRLPSCCTRSGSARRRISRPSGCSTTRTLRALSAMGTALRSPFGAFTLLWLVSYAGAAAVFSLYPVMMKQAFGVTPARSSIAFAVAATLGLLLYSPAGRWAEAARAASRPAFRPLDADRRLRGARRPGTDARARRPRLLAMGCFVVVVLAWSPLSVAGTAMAAELSPVGKGAGLGVFNAASAVAGVAGAAAAGWAASLWGYAAVAVLALCGAAFGFAWAFAVPPVGQER